jgi:hypothetical protein
MKYDDDDDRVGRKLVLSERLYHRSQTFLPGGRLFSGIARRSFET